jgi:hypothetical protein
MLPLALRKRRVVQAGRRISTEQLKAAMTPAPGVYAGLRARLARSR